MRLNLRKTARAYRVVRLLMLLAALPALADYGSAAVFSGCVLLGIGGGLIVRSFLLPVMMVRRAFSADQERRFETLLAEETVFLDDTEPVVDAARQLGMRAILFRNNEQAMAEIEARL